jgi:bacterioferritin
LLDGLPNLQDLGKLNIGEDVPESCDCDLGAERGAQATVKDGIAHCELVRDYVSRDPGTRSWTIPRSTSTTWKPRST